MAHWEENDDHHHGKLERMRHTDHLAQSLIQFGLLYSTLPIYLPQGSPPCESSLYVQHLARFWSLLGRLKEEQTDFRCIKVQQVRQAVAAATLLGDGGR